jgi:two-component system cell cycle response regulator CpdR
MTATTPKILIVDDEANIRRCLSLTFEQAGYIVKAAASGRDAIALCDHEAFNVVLSDVVMPEMDGHELAQWMAANRPDTHFALMSGFDPGSQGCSSSPRCDLIPKPFLPRQVVAFVEQVLAMPLPLLSSPGEPHRGPTPHESGTPERHGET